MNEQALEALEALLSERAEMRGCNLEIEYLEEPARWRAAFRRDDGVMLKNAETGDRRRALEALKIDTDGESPTGR